MRTEEGRLAGAGLTPCRTGPVPGERATARPRPPVGDGMPTRASRPRRTARAVPTGLSPQDCRHGPARGRAALRAAAQMWWGGFSSRKRARSAALPPAGGRSPHPWSVSSADCRSSGSSKIRAGRGFGSRCGRSCGCCSCCFASRGRGAGAALMSPGYGGTPRGVSRRGAGRWRPAALRAGEPQAGHDEGRRAEGAGPPPGRPGLARRPRGDQDRQPRGRPMATVMVRANRVAGLADRSGSGRRAFRARYRGRCAGCEGFPSRRGRFGRERGRRVRTAGTFTRHRLAFQRASTPTRGAAR